MDSFTQIALGAAVGEAVLGKKVGNRAMVWGAVGGTIPELTEVNASWSDWSWLLFWAIFTHPLLDCCTAYGTQVFQPFSDYRVALNNISVVDPIYTLPLIIGLLLAARLFRDSRLRSLFNYFGLGLSTAYLIFTFWNKSRIDTVFENTMIRDEIVWERYMTSPTIFNNVLWNCLAESEDAFYYGKYSLLDKEPMVNDLFRIPKGHEKLAAYQDDETIKILEWFSNDYYNVVTNKKGELQLNDLRFGTGSEGVISDEDYIFKFILEEKNGKISAHQTRERQETISETFATLWRRIKGK